VQEAVTQRVPGKQAAGSSKQRAVQGIIESVFRFSLVERKTKDKKKEKYCAAAGYN
jgi:hypothetical protein